MSLAEAFVAMMDRAAVAMGERMDRMLFYAEDPNPYDDTPEEFARKYDARRKREVREAWYARQSAIRKFEWLWGGGVDKRRPTAPYPKGEQS